MIIKLIIKKLEEYITAKLFRVILCAIITATFSAAIVSIYTFHEIKNPVAPIYDVDSWGHVIHKMKASENPILPLFQPNHPGRGFFIPFLFGLSYLILPLEECVHILNIIVQSLSVFFLVLFFGIHLKKPLYGITIGILWSVTPFHSYIYGYYYSEPIQGFIFVVIFFSTVLSIQNKSAIWPFLAGLFCTLGLFAKSANLLAVFFLTLTHLFFNKKFTSRNFLIFSSTLVLTFSFGPLYNFINYHKFVPFNLQSGFVLHEGTYLPGDDMEICYHRTLPEYQKIESSAKKLSPIERDAYFKKLAIQNIVQEPFKQILLIFKKVLRFWFYIRPHTWTPSLKTFLFFLPLLILAAVGIISNFKSIETITSASILLGLWLLYGLVHSEFRYNLPVFPFLLYNSIAGLAYLGSQMKVKCNKNSHTS